MKRVLSSGWLLVVLSAACGGDDEAVPRADGAIVFNSDAEPLVDAAINFDALLIDAAALDAGGSDGGGAP